MQQRVVAKSKLGSVMNDLALRVMPTRVLSLLVVLCGCVSAGQVLMIRYRYANGDQLTGMFSVNQRTTGSV